ncbi:MAG: diguanylate cyclase [Acidobacteria bacterium]|nr:diguanylate cyclase [Acidobacteriota bacterium]
MNRRSRLYVALVWLSGIAVWFQAGLEARQDWSLQFFFYLLFSIVSSTLKVRLPGVSGTMSVNYVFFLLGIIDLTALQALIISVAGTLTQSFFAPKVRPKLIQIIFNITSISSCVYVCYWVYHSAFLQRLDSSVSMLLFWTTLTYFVLNTFWTSGIIALVERRRVLEVWHESFFWTAPQYLFGAALSFLLHASNTRFGWQYSVLVIPGVYLLYRSYHLYLNRLAEEKKHVAEVADLHLRTIEALALAIEAKDDTTHAHLRRVQVYATEIAKELRLGAEEIKALEAAALLHDIGKLAVPEYIINKPGRLTKEEFEKMKVHPIVGAEILECVQFPHPVVPIVRSHHERWDGSGYPDGLKGEAIPIGARILATVDCLDALSSDRQYRKALPLVKALEYVCSEAGKSFDPQVVAVLKERCLELEEKVRKSTVRLSRLSTRARIPHGEAPAAGLEAGGKSATAAPSVSFIASIAAARQEFQTLHEVSRDLGSSLSLGDTLSLLANRLKNLVPYDSIVIYGLNHRHLIPLYAGGVDSDLFSSLRIPLGEGLSGWVAESSRPILNGNPSVECGYLSDPKKFSLLHSAIAVPLEAVSGVVGTLTLYRRETDAFSRDHLRILLAISSKAGMTIENALNYSLAEKKAETDSLTGLANAQSVFVHLDSEIARSKDAGRTLGVMVLDLDGFKEVNDRFGHLQGNKVLQNLAQALHKVCRQNDFIARMGGDEFVMVAPGITADAFEEKVKLFSKIVSEIGCQVCGEQVISLSAGYAIFPADGTDAETLLAEADRRMYHVKNLHHQQRKQFRPSEPEPYPAHLVQ